VLSRVSAKGIWKKRMLHWVRWMALTDTRNDWSFTSFAYLSFQWSSMDNIMRTRDFLLQLQGLHPFEFGACKTPEPGPEKLWVFNLDWWLIALLNAKFSWTYSHCLTSEPASVSAPTWISPHWDVSQPQDFAWTLAMLTLIYSWIFVRLTPILEGRFAINTRKLWVLLWRTHSYQPRT